MGAELNQKLFSAADSLRGKMSADQYKDYLLGLIFYKYLSDKLLESTVVKAYKSLDDIDTHVIDKDSNLLKIKREYFTKAYDSIVEDFASMWCVDVDELMVSVNQSIAGEDIYNKNRIVGSADYPVYVQQHPDSDPFSYPQHMIEAWKVCLFEEVIPLRDELK